MRESLPIVLAVLAWVVVGLISTAASYIFAAQSGHPTTVARALLSQGAWMLWCIATPALFWLSRRCPLVRPLRMLFVAVHVTAFVLMTVGFSAISTAVSYAARFEPSSSGFLAMFLRNLIGWSPVLLIAYASVLGLAHSFKFARQAQREQLENAVLARQLADAQLSALRMQLQPHFLFNTLNSVSMLIRNTDYTRAIQMVALLGDVLRALLRNSAKAESSLEEELAFLREYLEIEMVRFGPRLSVRWDIHPSAETAFVPTLILQPLVENALRHGLWPRPQGGSLEIIARADEAQVELIIRDDGIGLESPIRLSETTGLGLANTRARLERMYGSAAMLEVANDSRGGVRAIVRFPRHQVPLLQGR